MNDLLKITEEEEQALKNGETVEFSYIIEGYRLAVSAEETTECADDE